MKSTLKNRITDFFGYMAARKKTALKMRLMKRTSQNKAVPAWVIIRTHRHVRTNPKRRLWRRTDVNVG
ncbi:MAG TPA: 50S ribosomal protein L39e [Candidatus Nitrosopolaris rasttigaisensis]|nr:50S ribosomal protein L39e [Candidatus Nitrosopolaris rasttigaisensis]